MQAAFIEYKKRVPISVLYEGGLRCFLTSPVNRFPKLNAGPGVSVEFLLAIKMICGTTTKTKLWIMINQRLVNLHTKIVSNFRSNLKLSIFSTSSSGTNNNLVGNEVLVSY